MDKKIIEIVKTYAGDDTDLCYYVFNLIKHSKCPSDDLDYFMRTIKTQCSNETFLLEKKFTTDELQQLDILYTKYINELLIIMVREAHKSNWNVTKFYTTLWEKINTDILFNNDKIKSFVLW